MLREAFQVFELSFAEPKSQDQLAEMQPREDWAGTPLFAAENLPRPPD